MASNYGVNDIGKWRFAEIDLPQEWLEHLGELPELFRMYISGDPGEGKTEYIMKLSMMLANHYGKVHLNNVEQGKHKGILQSWERNNFKDEVPAGKWMYGNKLIKWDDYLKKMGNRNSGKVLIIDSISYWELTYAQVKELHELFPRKSLVFVAYGADYAKHRAIRHLCDIKVVVKDFEAKVRSRFGGMKPLIVWEKGFKDSKNKKPTGQIPLGL
ncbi:hypothetical protein [Reichenbachiella sp.]|uniref:hypothetical protein n=1 Tax=Reichenbachiella sp. TaxID=2184521 RepID=UPI003B59D253